MLAFASVAVLALSVVSAAPIPSRRATAPVGWASSYLESYDTYHARYRALGCAALKAQSSATGSEWDTCCHPLLANESLWSRPSQCIPSTEASSSAAAAIATQAASTEAPVQDDEEDCPVSSSAAPAAEPTTTSWAAEPTKAAKVAAAVETTTWEAPAPEPTPAAPSGGAVQSDAHATYFMQNGNAGACGNVNSESSHVVAIPYKWWGGNSGQASDRCGQTIDITRVSTGAKVTVTVADLCPTCTTDNSLDLSQGAFGAIASESEGQVDITWSWN